MFHLDSGKANESKSIQLRRESILTLNIQVLDNYTVDDKQDGSSKA